MEPIDKNLTEAIAHSFMRHPDSVDLNHFTSIEDAAAETLSQYKDWLSLNGLEEISDAAAASLGKHRQGLSLFGLTSLSAIAAKSLGNDRSIFYSSRLLPARATVVPHPVSTEFLTAQMAEEFMTRPEVVDLSHFTSIEFEAAELLRSYSGDLNLGGLTELPEITAEVLSHHSGRSLIVSDSVLTARVATILLRYRGCLRLTGLQNLGIDAAKILSSYSRELRVTNCHDDWGLNADVFAAIRKHPTIAATPIRCREFDAILASKALDLDSVSNAGGLITGLRDTHTTGSDFERGLELVQRASGQIIWRVEGGAFVQRIFSSDEIAFYFVGSVDEVRARLEAFPPRAVLTSDDALQFLADPTSIRLNEFTSIEEDAHECLPNYERGFQSDDPLRWSKAVSEYLSEHEGMLNLNGLTRLNESDAMVLGRHKGGLQLNGLTSLTDGAADSLANCWGALYLSGLTTLSDVAAKYLSSRGGDLFLNGLTNLSDAVAESFSDHEGELHLSGLTAISDMAAQSLGQHRCEYLNLSGLTNLSDAAAEGLSECREGLDLSGLTTLSDTAAEIFGESHCGFLELSGLTGLSDAAAKSLSLHEGTIYLGGLKSFSTFAIECFRNADGEVDFNDDWLVFSQHSEQSGAQGADDDGFDHDDEDDNDDGFFDECDDEDEEVEDEHEIKDGKFEMAEPYDVLDGSVSPSLAPESRSSLPDQHAVPNASTSSSPQNLPAKSGNTSSARERFLSTPPVQIAALTLGEAAPHEFATRSLGWRLNTHARIHGYNCQVELQVVVINSKKWDDNRRSEWLASARPLPLSDLKLTAAVTTFRTGSVGWAGDANWAVGREIVIVYGRLIVVKSKGWPV